MIVGRPIFPGNSTMNQLERVLELTGKPTADDIASIKSPFAATMIEGVASVKAKPLAEFFPGGSAEALDLIARTMAFNPDKRMTAYEALRHPYVAAFHNEADEPACPYVLKIQVDDNTKYSAADYRDRLYREIARRKTEAREARGGKDGAPAAAAAGGAAGGAGSS